MKKLLLAFILLLSAISFSQSCTHYIRLTDTYGDGWTGNRVSVSVNGLIVLSNLTLTSGYGPVTFSFAATNGALIRVWRSSTGSWSAECRTQILNSSLVPLTGVIATATGTPTSFGTTCIASCPTPGPCTNNIAYGTQFMPVFGGAPYETIYCQYAGEYSTWWNAYINTPYIVTSTVPTDWITVRRGTFNGPLVASGYHPLSFTSPISGTLYIHVNTNALCGTQNSCRNISVSRVSALPVELLYFDGKEINNANYLYWATATEHNSSHFILERSIDGYIWQELVQIAAAINSTQELHYDYTDINTESVFTYYRLMQYDIDGVYKQYGPIVIDNRTKSNVVIKRINLAGQEVGEDATGVIIEIYENGEVIKTIK